MSIQPLVAGTGLSPQGFSIHSLPGLLPFSPSNENSWLHLCLASAVFGALAVHAVVWGSTYVQCAPAIHLPSLLVACADGDKISLSWCLFCLVLPPDCFYPAVGLDHSLCRVCTPGNPAGGSPVRCQETLPQQQQQKKQDDNDNHNNNNNQNQNQNKNNTCVASALGCRLRALAPRVLDTFLAWPVAFLAVQRK